MKGILKHQMAHPSPDLEVKGILKSDRDKKESAEPKGILKRSDTEADSSNRQTEAVGKGILKHSQNLSKSLDGTAKGILKAADLQSGSEESNLQRTARESNTKLSASENSLLKPTSLFANEKSEGGNEDREVLKQNGVGKTSASLQNDDSAVEKCVDSSESVEKRSDVDANDLSLEQDNGEGETEKMFYLSNESTPERETTPDLSSTASSAKRKSRFQDRKSQGER